MDSLVTITIYLWLGFTVGYFFRKWLERRWIPGYRDAQRRDREPPP